MTHIVGTYLLELILLLSGGGGCATVPSVQCASGA